MRLQIIIFLFFLLSTYIVCLAQQEIEDLIEDEIEYSDQSELLELLIEIERHPLDINSATEQQLLMLPWLSPANVYNIIEYRKINGYFNNVAELEYVNGITPAMLTILNKYLTVHSTNTKKIFVLEQRSRIFHKIDDEQNISKNYQHNTPNKYYNKFNIKYNRNYEIGFLWEKDSYEKQLNDLALFYFKYDNPITKSKIILGNYCLEFGQGLTFWNPYGYGKGGNPTYSAIKRERGIIGYSMVDENASLFGLTSQICLKIYQLVIFYSHSKLDASLNLSGDVENFYNTGYHRTTNELAKKDVLGEELLGGRLIVQPDRNIAIGTTYYCSNYDREIKNPEIEKNRFDFRGKMNFVGSADIDVKLHNYQLFGEIAQSKNKGWGLVCGSHLNFKPIDLVFVARNYTKELQSLHGMGFGERGDHPQNEQGFYTGISYRIFKHTNLTLSFDRYKFPWRSYYEKMPINGKELLLKIEQKINRTLVFNGQLKVDTKDDYSVTFNRLGKRQRLNWRLQIDFTPVDELRLRGRVEKCNSKLETMSKGMLMYQDVRYQIKDRLTLYYRLTFFDIDDYESRIYQFENDLPFVLTNQMLDGRGNRQYLCIQYNLFSVFRIGLKYSLTNTEKEDSLHHRLKKMEYHSDQTINFQIESNYKL